VARVLMGDFGAIVRLGLWDILEDGGDLVTEETATSQVLDRLVATVPDVVVLDLDTAGVEQLARRIAVEFPAVKVIACSSVHPSMKIFPPFHHGESYVESLDPTRLVEAIRNRA
jgi:DNA-binding NarL/FixJ family response regulator